MKIIVTPDNSQYTAVIVDTKKDSLELIDKLKDLEADELKDKGRNCFRPFGIDYDEDYFYIASNNRVAKFIKSTNKYQELEINLKSKLDINTHLIRKKENTFYIANTATDVLAIISHNFEKYIHIPTRQVLDKPLNCIDAYDKDTVHLNSFCIKDNLIYYCLHNKNKSKSKYEVLNLNTNEIKHIVNAGWCSHGVEIIDNKLYSLSTGTGELIEHNLLSNLTRYYKLVNPENTFLRGLDKVNDTLYIGCSNVYDNPVIQNNCFLASFNVSNKEVKRVFDFKDIDIIADLRVI